MWLFKFKLAEHGNPSRKEAKIEVSGVKGQPGLHSETIAPKKKKKKI
jgi:hypothetical protein